MNGVGVSYTSDWKTYSKDKLAATFIRVAQKKSYSFAFWKLPDAPELYFLLDWREKTSKQKISLDKSITGFAIQLFRNQGNEEGYFLHADLLICLSSDEDIKITNHSNNIILADDFLESVKNALLENSSTSNNSLRTDDSAPAATDYLRYASLINNAVQHIHEYRFKKIVLARKKEISIAKLPDFEMLLPALAEEYPKALLSLVYTSETGLWLTASPETLVRVDKQELFHTMALAGTQRLNNPLHTTNQAVWTQKEIEEQALVSRYIINCFKKIRLREYEEDGPRTFRSGNLLHLRTDYTVNMKEVNYPELGTSMLELLHPTSAVCGMPKELTLQYIIENEGFDRKLFTGFLGPVNINSESHIFVNLRCAAIEPTKITLYAGAGITQDSIAEKEYQETELKMEALGSFLIKY